MALRYALKPNLTFGFQQRKDKQADLQSHYVLRVLGRNLVWITPYLPMLLESGAGKPSVSVAKFVKS